MNKVNQEAFTRLVQAIVKLHAGLIVAEPWVEIASETVQVGQHEIEDVIRKHTVVTKIKANVPISTLNGEGDSHIKSTDLLTQPTMSIPPKEYLRGKFDLAAAWKNAVSAMGEAVQSGVEAWNCIQPAVDSVVKAMAKWLKRDMDTERVMIKSVNLSYEAGVYSKASTLRSSWSSSVSGEGYRDYYSNPIGHTDIVGEADVKRVKGGLDLLLAGWIKDMEGIWSEAKAILQSGAVAIDGEAGTEVREQVTKMLQSIEIARQIIAVKRPYTEVCYAANLWRDDHGYFKKGAPAIVEAKCAFEELEKAIEQMEKNAIALAEALNRLFPSSEVSSSSQTK
jgi:hypothetical protein